jgi:hypothetical protein
MEVKIQKLKTTVQEQIFKILNLIFLTTRRTIQVNLSVTFYFSREINEII